MSNLHGCLETLSQGVWSILFPASYSNVIWGVFVLCKSVRLKAIGFAVQTAVKQPTSRQGEKQAYTYICVYAYRYKHACTGAHTHTNTHPASLSVPYGRSKRRRLWAIRQRMREHQRNELIKRVPVIEVNEKKGGTHGADANKRKGEENIHICPRANEVTIPMSHCYSGNNLCHYRPIR